MTTIKLANPVDDVENNTLTELTLREPTGGDLLECGIPFTIDTTDDGKERLNISTPAVWALIVKLANVPPLVVRRLSGRDFVHISMVIIGFFNVASPETSSTVATNSPGSSSAV